MCQQLIKRQEATCQDAPRTRGNTHQGRGGANHGSSWKTAARQRACRHFLSSVLELSGAALSSTDRETSDRNREREGKRERARQRSQKQAGRDTLTASLW